MYNVFDYLYWRSDITFKERPFNNIDNLIFARLSYLPFDRIITSKMTIKDVFKKCDELLNIKDYFHAEDYTLLKILGTSPRYKDLYLDHFINNISDEEEKQFAALTIFMPDMIYISYRGTDNTLVGFKEDCNMTFSDIVPSQAEALKYYNKISTLYDFPIILGGHSKGGNLAIYAGVHANDSTRIVSIFNNDGPGFLDELTTTSNYLNIKSKIHTFIPKSSIVGRLLNNSHDYKVVDSNQKGLLQHMLYTWCLNIDDFKYLNSVDKDSENIYRLLNDWMSKVTIEERKQFINTLYKILANTNAKTLDDLDNSWYQTIKSLAIGYKNTSKEEKELITKVLDYLFKSFKNTLMKK